MVEKVKKEKKKAITFTKKQIVSTFQVNGKTVNKIIIPNTSEFAGYTFLVDKDKCKESKFNPNIVYINLSVDKEVLIKKSTLSKRINEGEITNSYDENQRKISVPQLAEEMISFKESKITKKGKNSDSE